MMCAENIKCCTLQPYKWKDGDENSVGSFKFPVGA